MLTTRPPVVPSGSNRFSRSWLFGAVAPWIYSLSRLSTTCPHYFINVVVYLKKAHMYSINIKQFFRIVLNFRRYGYPIFEYCFSIEKDLFQVTTVLESILQYLMIIIILLLLLFKFIGQFARAKSFVSSD